eukprot:gene1692-461_t
MSTTELTENISQINDVSLDIFKSLVQASIKLLSGEAKLDLEGLLSALEPLSQKSEIPTRKLAVYVKILTVTFQKSIKQNQMESNLFQDEDKQIFMDNVFKKYYRTITQNVSKLSVNSLNDIDWRFGVSVSSSELSEVGATFLQLKLNINGKDEFIELDLPQFYNFLHEMEKGKSLLDFFSE